MSKNALTFLLFGLVVFLAVYSVWRISQPRILSVEEMKVNGFTLFGETEPIIDFKLIDHNGDVFTKANLENKKLNFLYYFHKDLSQIC